MNLFGIGIDVVETARIRRLIERQGDRFLDRVFTDGEIGYCRASKFPEQRYGARWAAKEAVSKALGTGIGETLGWKDIEVVRRPSGEPAIRLHGGAAAFAEANGIVEVKVSLTHTDHYAAANAFALGRDIT
ncbi:holo-ACP synthase [soil metagenome]